MQDRPITFSITTGTIIKTILLLIVAWLVFTLRDLVLDVLTAVVVASAIEPGVARLHRHKVPRIAAVVIVYLTVFIVLFGIFYFFLPSVFEDLATFVSALPNYINAFSSFGAFDQYAHILGITPPSMISTNDIMQSVRTSLDVGGIFDNAFTAVSAIFGGFFSFILIVVFSFYFAVIETGVDGFLRVVTPSEYVDYVLSLWKRSRTKIGLWMQGQLLLGFIMGILVYLGLTVLGIKHALILAVIAAVFEIIPVFGPTLSAVPAVMIGFVDGGLGIGLLVIALYVIFQQFENHLIYPLVVTRVVGVPPLLVILALIVGFELAGFLGILLSVPAAATIQELVTDLEASRRKTRDA